MTTQLVSVFSGTISNESTLLVNARELHEFLGVGKVFAAWITSRLQEYEFIDGQDYILVIQNGKTKVGRGGDRRSKDYHLTLDTAKELAMVERNEKGRQIRRYFSECEKRLLQNAVNSKPAPEPLSPNDMVNLKRLVWHMTNGMKFHEAWNQGMWYCLRSATGRPSPQPFSVEDLPVLAEECRRLLKVTTAYNAAVYDFEKDVIRSVVRKRGNFEPLIGKMHSQMQAIMEREQNGMLILDKFHETSVSNLICRK